GRLTLIFGIWPSHAQNTGTPEWRNPRKVFSNVPDLITGFQGTSMNQNTLEGGGQLRSDRPRTKTIFSKFLAGIIASVMALAGLIAIGPAAYADPTGISTSVLYNGQALEDGTVVTEGDTLRITTQYTNAVEDGSTVVIGIPTGVTVDESTL